jgi:hypothetical protein
MRSRTVTVTEGEMTGPIDWGHPLANDMPAIWREAENAPSDFVLTGDHPDRAIFAIGMYDGWPYWKPTPALLVESPLGGSEWIFFNSYGVHKNSIKPR